MPGKSKVLNLEEAVRRFVADGCSIAYGAVAGREPMAVSYEIVRQRKRVMDLQDKSRWDIRLNRHKLFALHESQVQDPRFKFDKNISLPLQRCPVPLLVMLRK